VQPFVLMLKSATENARAIENLKRTVLIAERSASTAQTALQNIAPLLEAAPTETVVSKQLEDIQARWKEREDEAKDRAAAAKRQLDARLAEVEDPRASAEEAFQSFFSERGRNFAYGLSAFFGTFFALRLLRRGALAAIGSKRNRTTIVRFGSFLFDIFTVIFAFGAMLSVFNLYNDWLLTGLTMLVLLALGWFVLRSAPSLLEQVTLLLNLGAVQENERVMFNGVPWRVKRLDVYSDLENPVLRGGTFTVPIRTLKGLYSRPMDEQEDWFPSVEGDYVRLENGLLGLVTFQSPEAVRVEEDGGATTSFTLPAFLALNPTNLSHGFQVRAHLRLDQSHRADALDIIPHFLKNFTEQRLTHAFGASILSVEAALKKIGDTSVDFDVEIALTGDAAARYDAIEKALNVAVLAAVVDRSWTLAPPSYAVTRSGSKP
jgi:hypothetical protein